MKIQSPQTTPNPAFNPDSAKARSRLTLRWALPVAPCRVYKHQARSARKTPLRIYSKATLRASWLSRVCKLRGSIFPILHNRSLLAFQVPVCQ